MNFLPKCGFDSLFGAVPDQTFGKYENSVEIEGSDPFHQGLLHL